MIYKFLTKFVLFFLLISFVLSNFIFLWSADINLNEKKMPVINLTVENSRALNRKSDYVPGTMEIVHDKYGLSTAPMQIKVRGNSTAGMPKKPYHIKLDTSTNLFGMGKNKHWLLLADAMDRTHLRNKLAFDLSKNLGMDYVESTYAEVYLNGAYIGLYMFCEQIRVGSSRVDIYDWEDFAEDIAKLIGKAEGKTDEEIYDLGEAMKSNLAWITTGTYKSYKISDYYDISNLDITGGYLIENDDYFDEISKFRTDNEVLLMIQKPQYANTNTQMFSYIQTYMQDMEDAIYSKTRYNSEGMHYTEYFDLESFIDFWIVFEGFKNVELLYKSCYMYKDIGEKVVFGPVWDFDWSSGNHVNLGGYSGAYDTWEISESQNRRYWYQQLFGDPFFMTRLKERWNNSFDLMYGMLGSIDTYYEYLAPFVEKNLDKWGSSGWDYEREVDTLRTWLINRIEWVNNQLAAENPNILNRGWQADESIEITHTQKGSIITFTIKCVEDANKLGIYLNGIIQPVITLENGTGTFTLDTSKPFPNQRSNDNTYEYENHVLTVQKYEDGSTTPSAMNYTVFKVASSADEKSEPAADQPSTTGTLSINNNVSNNFLFVGIGFAVVAVLFIIFIVSKKVAAKKAD